MRARESVAGEERGATGGGIDSSMGELRVSRDVSSSTNLWSSDEDDGVLPMLS
jgi:hypothetical protein